MTLKLPWPELSPEDRGRTVDALCAQVRAGEDVPRADLLRLLDYLDDARAWTRALHEGWEKDSQRRAAFSGPSPLEMRLPGRLDGRSVQARRARAEKGP